MRKANGLVNFKFLFCNGYSLLYTSRYLTLQLANRVIFSSLTSRANYCVLVAVRRKCTITLGALGKQRSLGEKLPLVLSELPYDLGGINVNQVEVFRMFWIKVLRIYFGQNFTKCYDISIEVSHRILGFCSEEYLLVAVFGHTEVVSRCLKSSWCDRTLRFGFI